MLFRSNSFYLAFGDMMNKTVDTLKNLPPGTTYEEALALVKENCKEEEPSTVSVVPVKLEDTSVTFDLSSNETKYYEPDLEVPQLSKKKKRQIDALYSNLVLMAKLTRRPGQLWFDTGCRRCVGGPEVHFRIQTALSKVGLLPMRIDKQEEFIFGDAKTSTSDCAFLYPSFLNGRFSGLVDMARVPVPCPGLFSLKQAKKWQCVTDHAKEQLIVKRHGRTFDFEKSTPYIDILDFEPDQKLDFSDLPLEFFMD